MQLNHDIQKYAIDISLSLSQTLQWKILTPCCRQSTVLRFILDEGQIYRGGGSGEPLALDRGAGVLFFIMQ